MGFRARVPCSVTKSSGQILFWWENKLYKWSIMVIAIPYGVGISTERRINNVFWHVSSSQKRIFRILHSKSKGNQYKIKARLQGIEGKSRFVTWYICTTAVIESSQLCIYSIISGVWPHFPRVLVEISRLRVFSWCEPDNHDKHQQSTGEYRDFSGSGWLQRALLELRSDFT